jgi:hypothetical protein
MVDATGLASKAAYKKDPGENATAPTGIKTYPHTPGATDLAANDLIPFTHESLSLAVERSVDPALLGGGAAPPGPIVLENCSGAVGGRLRYNGWARPFQQAHGFEYSHSTNGSPKSLGSGAYAHLFELDHALQDQAYLAGERETFHANDRKVRRGQIGLAKQVEDWIFGSCMFTKFTVRGTPTEVTTEFEAIPYYLYRGSYNSSNWTEPSGSTAQALFQQTEIKLARRSDTPGSMVTIKASEFELVVDNGLRGGETATGVAPKIIIPVREALKNVTLKIARPRYSSDESDDQLIGYFQTDQEFSAIITITGPLIGGSIYYKYKFCLPSLRATGPLGPANIEGPGPLAQEWNFRAYRPVTTDPFAATEYESITVLKDSELVMMHYNEENVNYLTES